MVHVGVEGVPPQEGGGGGGDGQEGEEGGAGQPSPHPKRTQETKLFFIVVCFARQYCTKENLRMFILFVFLIFFAFKTEKSTVLLA